MNAHTTVRVDTSYHSHSVHSYHVTSPVSQSDAQCLLVCKMLNPKLGLNDLSFSDRNLKQMLPLFPTD